MTYSACYRALGAALLACLATASAARASFHEMQIEQVIAGVCGDTDKQAIQLRQRFAFQNFVTGKLLRAYDAQGNNGVTLLTFPSDAGNGAAGSRILITTPSFAAAFGIAGDFTLAQSIPTSYLTAGRVTFEDNGSFGILWALAWGGASYTGSNLGDPFHINDADGNFGAAFAGLAPYSSTKAVRFQGAASAGSTTNAADYAYTAGAATFVNNAGSVSVAPGCLFSDGFLSGDLQAWSAVQSGP